MASVAGAGAYGVRCRGTKRFLLRSWEGYGPDGQRVLPGVVGGSEPEGLPCGKLSEGGFLLHHVVAPGAEECWYVRQVVAHRLHGGAAEPGRLGAGVEPVGDVKRMSTDAS